MNNLKQEIIQLQMMFKVLRKTKRELFPQLICFLYKNQKVLRD